MRTLLSIIIPAVLVAGALPISAAEAPQAELDPSQIVTATLLADTTAVQPDTTVTLAVHYKIAPGWHIYWKNPGASGLATRVDWGLPNGMSMGQTQFPAPIMFESPGPITSYGYEGEVLLLMETRTPANVQGPLQFTAKTRWLMCSDRCIPGKKDLTLTLEVGNGQAANQELFKRFRKQLPRTVYTLPQDVTLTENPEGEKVNFKLTVAPPAAGMLVGEDKAPELRSVYFFPEAQEGIVFEGGEVPQPNATANVNGQTIKAYKAPVTISYFMEGGAANATKPRVAGVLVYQPISAQGKAASPQLLDLQLP